MEQEEGGVSTVNTAE
jgi:estrogen-related receptor beta like 1